ncbi:hypothetical protein A2U01_0119518, partial [Trifolium medium]|nr:hypothetical protein [Trifolium medium]
MDGEGRRQREEAAALELRWTAGGEKRERNNV